MSQYFANFFAGLFLCNSIPHLISGLLGEPFPTPFAKPHGVGPSSPLINFLWGYANLVVALLLFWLAPVALTPNIGLLLVLVGAAASGIFAARHFGGVKSEWSRG